MTVGGQREQDEREVLATLIEHGGAYKQLPEGFDGGAFELPEYRSLFETIRLHFIERGKRVSEAELLQKHPDLKSLIDSVLFGALPLNGRLRSRAAFLMRHRPRNFGGDDSSGAVKHRAHELNNQAFKFELLSGREISEMMILEQSFLVKNLISEQSVNFLSGEEGCGKSLIAMNLGISLAVGAAKWLAYDIAKSGKVLYLNNELAFSDFARRVKSMSGSLPAPGDVANFIVPKEVPALDQCWETLNETCEQIRPCLIIVDCLYFAHDKDENDSSEMKALMRQFLALRDRYNLALLLIHHTKKAARYERMHNDQMRGSNVFGGITDTVLQMRRSAADESKRIIKPTKFRHVSDENRKCRLLSLNRETLWFKDEGETDEGDHIATAVQTAEESIDFVGVFGDKKELSRKEIQERCQPLGYDERTIDRILKKAKSSGSLKVPRYGYYGL
jgi:hypothetical protein